MTPDELSELTRRLAEPFDPSEVKHKAQTVKGNRALAVAFVDARVIQDRLDEVLGVMGWQDSYECLADGSVVCRLKVRLPGGEWITKEDVGGQSEQPDEGDRRKAAFSDALKRAAVKFGLGRYLYRLPLQWVDYDPQKRQFTRTPQLPAWALPDRKAVPTPPEPARKPSPAPAPAANGNGGRNGGHAAQSVLQRVEAFEAKLLAGGLCAAGECMDHVHRQLSPKYGDAMSGWPAEAADEAREACLAFRAALEAPADPADVARVAAELARTGEGWGRVCTAFGWQGKSRANLTGAEARAVLARLREHPGKAEG